MRELGLWDGEEGIRATFDDIEQLAALCRFTDCSHQTEPDCAIRAAREAGTLDEARWNSFLKLHRELDYERAKGDLAQQAANKKRWKKVHTNQRARMRFRDAQNE